VIHVFKHPWSLDYTQLLNSYELAVKYTSENHYVFYIRIREGRIRSSDGLSRPLTEYRLTQPSRLSAVMRGCRMSSFKPELLVTEGEDATCAWIKRLTALSPMIRTCTADFRKGPSTMVRYDNNDVHTWDLNAFRLVVVTNRPIKRAEVLSQVLTEHNLICLTSGLAGVIALG